MQIRIESKKSPKTEGLIIPFFKGEVKVPMFLNEVDKKLIARLVKSKEFKSELNETALDLSAGTVTKLLLLGLGEKDKLTLAQFWRVAGTAILRLKKSHAKDVTFWVQRELTSKFNVHDLGQTLAEAAFISGYTYLKYKTQDKNSDQIRDFVIKLEDAKVESELQKGARVGKVIATSVNMTRDYGNSPSSDLTPTRLSELAREIAAEFPVMKLTILGRKEIAKEKMGGLLGVAKGSVEEPKFIVMEYWGAGKSPISKSAKVAKKVTKAKAPIVLVGKGITFDSGGISIKPSAALDEMKFDMAGGGAVLGVLRSVAALKLPINAVGLVPATENMPSGSAYKPGDILTISDGTTVEVLNTDAEGRIVLADGLVYARRYKPEIVVDLATLTGACVVALGDFAAGLFTKDEKLRNELTHASTHTGDNVWPMPLYEEYKEKMKSNVADIRNFSTNERYGGAITGALFLEHFVKNFHWAHLDIAGTAWSTQGTSYLEPGATGAGVRLMVQFLRELL